MASDGTWLGDCRQQPQRGDFKPDAPICGSFLSIDAPIPAALPEQPTRHRSRTLGARAQASPSPRNAGEVGKASPSPHAAPPSYPPTAVGDAIELDHMTSEDLKTLLREALQETDGEVLLAPKWEGGTLVLKPRDPALQAREIPIDQLLHKVVMVRDRLRVLEQKLNSNPKLSDAEKVDLQQYVTRCYGSLTTFNQLFRDKADHFVGERGEE